MDIIIRNRDLIDLLKGAATTTGKPGNSPMDGQLLVNITPDGMSVIGNNERMETEVRSAQYRGDSCSFTLPAKKVLDITQAIDITQDIRLRDDGERIRLQAGKGRYVLASLPGEQYPRIAANDAIHQFTLDAEGFCDSLNRVAFAMASGDVRPYLNGALLDGRDDYLILVATDGHRLLCYRIDAPSHGEFQAILPRDAITALSKLCKTFEGDITVEVCNGYVRFVLGDTVFVTRLIDAKYPDYRRVIPTAEKYRVKCNREMLLQAVKRARILANDKHPGIRFDFSTNLLRLSAHKDETNECQEEIPVEYSGEEFSTGFNANILIEGLGAMDSDNIDMAFLDSDSATLFKDSALTHITNVAMPMRV